MALMTLHRSIQDGPSRGLVSISIDPPRTVFHFGKENDRQALSMRKPIELMGVSFLLRNGFNHTGDELVYVRSVNPAHVQDQRQEKVRSHIEVGKIFGTFR